jgi:uncharacterized protein (TIGR02271 family)
MPTTITLDELQSARGTPVYSSDGDKIGSVEEIYVDEQTDQPEWIGVGTGIFGVKRVLVPVEGASIREDGLLVPYGKDQVKDTPDIDADEISQETEAQLYSHYGLTYSEDRSDTGLPDGGDAAAGSAAGLDTGLAAGRPGPDSPGDASEGQPAVTRSEEELRVGKRETQAGRARLRKWVETEPVEADVELRKERVRVERQPVEQPVSGAEIGDEEVEIPVHEEEAVVQKQAVAKERISLEKDVDTARETVRDELRKERVDVDEDVTR